jgi:hypothetical protein
MEAARGAGRVAQATSRKRENGHRVEATFWGLPDGTARFASKAVADTLPTRVNLQRWGKLPPSTGAKSDCPRCPGKKETLRHILSGCKPALEEGRYKWRHDRVLQRVCEIIQQHKPEAKIQADLNGWEYREAAALIDSGQRPDIMVTENSAGESIVTMIELTCPYEDNIQKDHNSKMDKYTTLAHQLGAKLICCEVGCRGHTPPSVSTLANWMKLKDGEAKRLRNELGRTAIQSSYVLWKVREDQWKASVQA